MSYDWNKRYTPDEMQRMQGFAWEEDASGENEQPGIDVAKQVSDCAEKITQYVLDNVSLDHFDQNHLSVPIPLDTHPLLQSRYNNKWTDESREDFFELVRGACLLATDSESYKEDLEGKINRDLFPQEVTESQIIDDLMKIAEARNAQVKSKVGVSSNRYKIQWMRIYDEPTVSVDEPSGGEVVMEIRLESVST